MILFVKTRYLVSSFPINRLGLCVPPSPELHDRAWYWAGRLNQSKTYDAQYVALAELERADFWTADRRLVNGARQAGAGWVHWIGEEESGRQ